MIAPFEGTMLRVVAPLALAETLIWAVTFYMFPAMLPAWEADLGWDKTTLSGAFTVALLLSAFFAPVAGRLIDRHHGRVTMAASVLLACLMLLLLSHARTPVTFYLAWAGLGVAMGGALYEACFAFVTRLLGDRARPAITAITLVAGLAGTVSFPLTHWLNGVLGWRDTLLVYAAIALVVVMPLVLSVPGAPRRDAREHATASGYSLRDALASPLFWLLAVGFALVALEHGIVITHLLPILHDRGLSETAAVTAASLIGPMQVAGRLGMVAVQSRIGVIAIAMLSVGCLAGAAASLYLAAAVAVFAAPFVLLQGAGNGVVSIVRPVLTAECMGYEHFGAISGVIGMMFMAMLAIAPSVASILWRAGGYDLVIGFAACCCAVSLLCLARVSSLRRHR